MSQSLFNDSAAAGPLGGVMDRLAEGQEELRGEMGVLVERLDALDQKVRALSSDHSAGRTELERSHSHLRDGAVRGQRREKVLTYGVIAAAGLAIAALVAALTAV
jgi:hypothetical protein